MSAPLTKDNHWREAKTSALSHSNQIRLLRILLPAVAACILAALFLWSPVSHMLEKRDARASIQPQDLTLRNTVTKPRITGLDKEGRPYHLNANEAHQTAPEQARMSHPTGDIVCKDGAQIFVDSKQGTYAAKDEVLTCQEDVHIRTSHGYHVTSDEAKVDFPEKMAHGQGHVHADGPAGILEGNEGFTMTQDGVLHVPGPSKMTLK
ncbi:MAG: LPS export ABC transporter periplasmic protein LptC [Proteobacteria bacterium]|nr:LPS export ABC transporter periplasmic protein LptC [Pseudomonadota bacterium]